ncbi:MAG: ATP cone domain-containing protein, partial [Bacteroidota bacterium]
MEITHITKRDFSTKPFQLRKITEAVMKAMEAVDQGEIADAQLIANSVYAELLSRKGDDEQYVPTVEEVQDIVEQVLMKSEFHDVAKAYIIYRNTQAQKRQTNIFEKRINLKPFEYPKLYEYVSAIRHSYWIHTEFNFTSDVQDFKSRLNEVERSA